MKYILSFFLGFLLMGAIPAQAQIPTESFVERVHAVIEEIQSKEDLSGDLFQYKLRVKLESGEIVQVNTEDSFLRGISVELKKGQKIYLQKIGGEQSIYFFEDLVRTRGLILVFLVFLIFTLIIGLMRGVWSTIGLMITLWILFGMMFPAILAGKDVLLVTIFGSIAILAVNMHISHGFRKESFLAFSSTVIGFLLVWCFATLFTKWTFITGTGSEEASLLLSDIPVSISIVKLYLAGVMLGAVGVLDDIAISQTEIVHELMVTDPSMTFKKRFIPAMRIGRHHIASTVNTLVLVYAGASMPILLLFLSNSGDVLSFINSEIVTEEIVRTLAGTVALILTVPISTLIAAYGYSTKHIDRTPHAH